MKSSSYLTGILCATLTAISMNGATSEPMLFYCDDAVEAFPREEVDSITFSRYDIDSVLCNSLATQIVWSGGLPTRYPIETTDSVLFASPVKNKLLPGVREIKGALWDHVISCEDNHILHISPSIPEDLIPRTGEKLVTTEMSTKFPIGFIGEVQTVSRTPDEIVVDCEQLGLTDVYSSFSGIFDSDITNNGQIEDNSGEENQPARLNPVPAPQAVKGKLDLTLPTFRNTVSLGASTLGGLLDLNIGLNNSFTFELTPTLHVRTFTMIESLGKLNTSSRITADLHCRETLNSNLTVNYSHDWDLTRGMIMKPVAPGLMLYMEGGMTLSANGQCAIESESNQHFRLSAVASMTTEGTKRKIRPTLGMRLVDSGSSYSGAVGSATVSLGGYLEVGLAAIHKDLLNVHARAEFGARAMLDASVEDWEIECSRGIAANMYNKLSKEDAFQFGSYTAATLGAEALGGTISANLDLLDSFQPLFRTSILPRFRDVRANRREGYPSIVDVSADIVPGLLNCTYGWKMIERPDEEHYRLLDEKTGLTDKSAKTTFNNVSYDSERYFVPTLQLPNNMTIAARPHGQTGTVETDCLEARFEDEYFTVDAKYKDDVMNMTTGYNPIPDCQFRPCFELSLPFDSFDYESIINDTEDIVELGYYIHCEYPNSSFDIESFINGNWGNHYEQAPWHLLLDMGDLVYIPIYENGKWLIDPSTKRHTFCLPPNVHPGVLELSENSVLLYAYGFTGIYVKRKGWNPDSVDGKAVVNITPWIWRDIDTNMSPTYQMTSSSISILDREKPTFEITLSLKMNRGKYLTRNADIIYFPPSRIRECYLPFAYKDLIYQHLFDRYPEKDTMSLTAFKYRDYFDNITFQPYFLHDMKYSIENCSNYLYATINWRWSDGSSPEEQHMIITGASTEIRDK